MITINQLAYQMKTDEARILKAINDCNKYDRTVRIKNNAIQNKAGVIVGLMIFLDCTYHQATRLRKSYSDWKKTHKKNAQII